MPHTRWTTLILIAGMVGFASAPPLVAAAGAAGPLPGLATPAATKAAAKCQKAIAKSGATFLNVKLAILDRCSTGILTCLQKKPGDPTCLTNARASCAQAIDETIPTVEAKLAANIVKSCGQLSRADLLADDGLGFGRLAGECQADICGDLTNLAQCIVQEHERAAERLFSAEQPRAGELIADVSAATALPDLALYPGCGDCSQPPPDTVGNAIVACGAATTKAGRNFAGKVLKATEQCAGDVFTCIQKSPSDPDCRPRETAACDAGTAMLQADCLEKVATRCAKKAPEAQASCLAKGEQRCADKATKNQTKCLRSAATTCDKRTARATACLESARIDCEKGAEQLAKDRAKLTTGIDKRCSAETLLPYATLRSAIALNVDALDEECRDLGFTVAAGLDDYVGCLRRHHECHVAELLTKVVPRSETFVEAELLGGGVSALLSASPCPTPLAKAAALRGDLEGKPRAFAFFKIKSFFGSITKVVPSQPGVKAVTVGQPAPQSSEHAPRRVSILSGSPRFRPRFGQLVKLGYRLFHPNGLGTERTEAASETPPVLIITVRRDDLVIEDHLELPLDADKDEVELQIEYADDVPTCAFEIAFATSDGGVSDYTPLEQVLDVAQPTASPTPTRTATPAQAQTPTVTATPAGEPSTLACADVISAAISPSGDSDAFRFQGTAGQQVSLTLILTGGFDSFNGVVPQFTLFAPSGADLGSFNANTRRDFTLDETGTYVARVRANNLAGTGNYNLGLDCRVPLGPVDATLTCGQIVSEQISKPGDADFVTFEGTVGQQISLALILTGGFDSFNGVVPQFTLFTPSGAAVATFDANTRRDFTLAETGTYVVRVSANNLAGTGSYNLGLDCRVPLGPVDATLTCGDIVSEQISKAADADFLTFSGTAGQQISLTLILTAGFDSFNGVVPQFTLFTPSGAAVATFDANTRRDFTLADTGTYVVRVSANNLVGTGSYNLGLDCRVPLGPVDATLSCGNIVSEQISKAADADFLTFSGTVGQQISLTLILTAGFDSFNGVVPQFTLFTPSGLEIGTFNANTSRDFTLDAAGTYVVRVSASNLASTGSYNLGLDCL